MREFFIWCMYRLKENRKFSSMLIECFYQWKFEIGQEYFQTAIVAQTLFLSSTKCWGNDCLLKYVFKHLLCAKLVSLSQMIWNRINSRLLCGKLVRGRGVPLKSRDWRSDTTSLATAVLHNKQTTNKQTTNTKQTPLLWQAILRSIQIQNELVPKINGYTTNKWTKEHNKQILVWLWRERWRSTRAQHKSLPLHHMPLVKVKNY